MVSYQAQLGAHRIDGAGASEFVNQVISSQASTLGVNDVFNLMGVIFLTLIPIIWFSKPPFGARAAKSDALNRVGSLAVSLALYRCHRRNASSQFFHGVGDAPRVERPHNESGARIKLISGPLLQLPLYQPENPERSEGARLLVAELALADGIIIGSPGYHGSISGLVKNALDYAEDLRTDARPYFSGRPSDASLPPAAGRRH